MRERLRNDLLLMGDLPLEQIWVWFIDGNGAVITRWIATEGGPDWAALALRELFRRAWEHQACALVVAHNHTNGNPSPSREDAEFTQQVEELGVTCEAILLDHFVVGGNTVYSFTEDTISTL